MRAILSVYICVFSFLVAVRGESEPERKETRQKVDEDRKHEYPLHHFSIPDDYYLLFS